MHWRDRRWETSRTINASEGTVWDLLTETRHWPRWGPTVSAVEGPERIGPGSTGRIRTPVGLWLPFEITEYRATDHWAWEVAGRPATTHRIEPAAGGGTTVTFTAPGWALPYVVVLHHGLRRLATLAERA